jgi:hypothetical protein
MFALDIHRFPSLAKRFGQLLTDRKNQVNHHFSISPKIVQRLNIIALVNTLRGNSIDHLTAIDHHAFFDFKKEVTLIHTAKSAVHVFEQRTPSTPKLPRKPMGKDPTGKGWEHGIESHLLKTPRHLIMDGGFKRLQVKPLALNRPSADVPAPKRGVGRHELHRHSVVFKKMLEGLVAEAEFFTFKEQYFGQLGGHGAVLSFQSCFDADFRVIWTLWLVKLTG